MVSVQRRPASTDFRFMQAALSQYAFCVRQIDGVWNINGHPFLGLLGISIGGDATKQTEAEAAAIAAVEARIRFWDGTLATLKR